MLEGVYAAASGIHAAQQNQEVIARNLAHVNTPGYRREVAGFEQLWSQALGYGAEHGTALGQIQTDFSPGAFETTGRPLDVALEGDGFFELQTPAGPRYTRNGNFFLNSDGALVAASGYPVQGQGGSLRVPPGISAEQLVITQDGQILADGTTIGSFRLTRFENPQALLRDGVALFAAGNAEGAPADVTVRQGVQERANVEATQELVRMIAGLRHHEAAQQALKSLSDTLRQHTQT